jgi:hypothetical protein
LTRGAQVTSHQRISQGAWPGHLAYNVLRALECNAIHEGTAAH